MWWRRKRSQADFDAEIRAHLELEQHHLEHDGVAGDEAGFAARRAFGNVSTARERYYESHRWVWAGNFFRDCRYAMRVLGKTPWFTSAAILILAVAIGANLAAFSLIDALMLRTIPVARPQELVQIQPVGPQGPLNGMPSTVLDLLRTEPAFHGLCGFTTPRVTTLINGRIGSTGTLAMTGDCFQTLGVRTQIGRPFSMADDQPEAPAVAVLTAALWRDAFGGSAAVLGKHVQAGAESFTVIGVASDDFTGLLKAFEPGLIIPLNHTPTEMVRRRIAYYWVTVFARRAPGTSLGAASARIGARSASLLEQTVPLRYNQAQRRNYLSNRLMVSSAATGVDWMLRNRFGNPLFALLGLCAAILWIACLNLASLLLARALSRRREIAIRAAIGASRWRVMRPLMLESLFLAIAGGIGGLVFQSWAGKSIVAEASAMFPNFTLDASLSRQGIALLAGMVVWVAGILTIVPTWQTRRFLLSSRGIVGSHERTQKILIAVQVAFTLALVTASGALAASFRNLAGLPLGLRTEGVVETLLSPLPGGYRGDNPQPYYESLLRQVASLPGIQSASLSSLALYWHRLSPAIVRSDDGGRELRAPVVRISDGFFQTIGARLQTGEDFGRDRSVPEAIVSDLAARLLDAQPGRFIQIGETGAAKRYRVIGVAPTLRLSMVGADEAGPLVYTNFWQETKEQRYPVLLVKGANATPDVKSLGSVVQGLGREYIDEYRPLQVSHDESIAEDRLLAYLATASGLLALLLAAIGLFAILSCFVARRTGEIGVRMALGADAARIRRLVIGQVGMVLLAGIPAGVALAWIGGGALRKMNYGEARDPLLLALAILAITLTVLVAALIPARRATSIQPIVALRQE